MHVPDAFERDMTLGKDRIPEVVWHDGLADRGLP